MHHGAMKRTLVYIDPLTSRHPPLGWCTSQSCSWRTFTGLQGEVVELVCWWHLQYFGNLAFAQSPSRCFYLLKNWYFQRGKVPSLSIPFPHTLLGATVTEPYSAGRGLLLWCLWTPKIQINWQLLQFLVWPAMLGAATLKPKSAMYLLDVCGFTSLFGFGRNCSSFAASWVCQQYFCNSEAFHCTAAAGSQVWALIRIAGLFSGIKSLLNLAGEEALASHERMNLIGNGVLIDSRVI